MVKGNFKMEKYRIEEFNGIYTIYEYDENHHAYLFARKVAANSEKEAIEYHEIISDGEIKIDC
jgi:hypothetical protein